jgi:hypothetical protein
VFMASIDFFSFKVPMPSEYIAIFTLNLKNASAIRDDIQARNVSSHLWNIYILSRTIHLLQRSKRYTENKVSASK